MATINNLGPVDNSIDKMLDAIKSYIDKKSPKQTMTTAEVISTEKNTVWVRVKGGVKKTPVKKTINCKQGDTVQVCIDNGNAFLVGNETSPPTDDTAADIVQTQVQSVNKVALQAADKADDAVAATEAIKDDIDTLSDNVSDLSEDVSLINETAVTGVVIEYAKGTSQQDPPETGWDPATPVWEEGKYIWQRTVTTIDGEQIVSNTACIQGAEGQPGISIASVTEYYLATNASSGVTPSTSGWTTTIQNISADKQFLWNYEVTTGNNGSIISTTTPVIIGRYGLDGQPGQPGEPGEPGQPGTPGRGIVSITEHYQISDSNTTAPTTWSDTVVNTTVAKPYLWNYETITYTTGSPEDTAARVIGTHGTPGSSITVTSEERAYQLSTSGTAIPTGTWSSSPVAPTTTQYAWTRTIVHFSDGSTATTYTVGGKTGTNGQPGTSPTVTNSVTQYQKSTSGTAVPTGTWSNTPVAPDINNYVWTKTTITYSDGSTATTYSVGGKTGATGDTGRGISNITPQYYLSTSSSSATGGSWVTTPPAYVEGRYYWIRSKVEWTSGTSVTYVPSEAGVLDNALTDANSKAYQALRTAGSAEDIATATNQHFWTDTDGVHIANQASTPAATRNTLWNSLGMLFRRGVNNILAIVTGEQSGTSPGIEIYDGQGNAASNIIAKFTGTIARIGKESGSHSEIDANGQRFYGSNGTTQLANIGYDKGKSQSGSTSSDKYPYYTFGTRQSDTETTRGNYSFAEGHSNDAVGYCSHAEGETTLAQGHYSHSEGKSTDALGLFSHAEGSSTQAKGESSHAEGYQTVANTSYSHAEGNYSEAVGQASHAEGNHTQSSGLSSHAEGYYSKANADYSHAQNQGTLASSNSQTAIGKYNNEDTENKYALIIGNGVDGARSDAFKVDWNGKVYKGNDNTYNIGYINDSAFHKRDEWSGDNYSVPSGSSRALGYIDIPPGNWIVRYSVRWASNSSGVRRIGLSTSASDGENPIGVIYPAGSAAIQIEAVTMIANTTSSNSRRYLHAMHNAGTAINVTAANAAIARIG